MIDLSAEGRECGTGAFEITEARRLLEGEVAAVAATSPGNAHNAMHNPLSELIEHLLDVTETDQRRRALACRTV